MNDVTQLLKNPCPVIRVAFLGEPWAVFNNPSVAMVTTFYYDPIHNGHLS